MEEKSKNNTKNINDKSNNINSEREQLKQKTEKKIDNNPKNSQAIEISVINDQLLNNNITNVDIKSVIIDNNTSLNCNNQDKNEKKEPVNVDKKNEAESNKIVKVSGNENEKATKKELFKMHYIESLNEDHHSVKELFIYCFKYFTPFTQGFIEFYQGKMELLLFLLMLNLSLQNTAIDMFVNGWFFLEDSITAKYYKKFMGAFWYDFLKNSSSFFISLLISLLTGIFLNRMIKKIEKKEKIFYINLKFGIFCLVEIVILIVIVYHHSLIGIIYKNSQVSIYVVEMLTFIFNYIVICFVCLVLSLLRKGGLHFKKKLMFKISQVLFKITNFLFG